MTIEIDDAGTGDLVGDAIIGLMRKETGELIFKAIPVKLFQGENWKNREPYKKTVELVIEGLDQLNYQNNGEKILLCRGNIFDDLRTFFDDQGIEYEPAIIEGELQDAVEGKLVKHLRYDLGVRSRNLTTKSGAKRYFVLFNWVTYDFYRREKYVKSGFKKWNTVWRTQAIERYNRSRNVPKNR